MNAPFCGAFFLCSSPFTGGVTWYFYGMTIERQLLTGNSFSRCGRLLAGSVRGIVIHWVANPGSSAQANRNYFEGLKKQRQTDNARYASAHFIVGLNGEVIQCLPVNETAYHVGAVSYRAGISEKLSSYPNNCTIGIELCHPDWSGRFTDNTYGSAVELTGTLLKQFELNPQKDVYRHFDITGKDCPKFFVNNEAAWTRFKADVETYLIGIA